MSHTPATHKSPRGHLWNSATLQVIFKMPIFIGILTTTPVLHAIRTQQECIQHNQDFIK